MCTMSRTICATSAIVLLTAPAAGAAQHAAQSAPQPVAQLPAWTASVDAALGRHGAMNPGNVYKFSFPRSDMHVMVQGVRVLPALALGSWIAFRPAGTAGSVMVMGDLVLGENEAEAVMKALQTAGVEQTALHNHLLHEVPRVMYMHISAMGDPVKIARAIHAALALSATPLGSPAAKPAAAAAIALDTTAVARALGYKGKVNGGVYQVSVPRAEVIREGNDTVPPAMGTATSINFQPTGGSNAAITGDFVLLAREVNPVIRALRSHGIEVTAIHSHMLTEEPRIFFMHFWANDNAVALARGLRAAIDETSSRRP
jgi:uncharacterized protein DUF1259